MRKTATWQRIVVAAALTALAGCGRSDTGVRIVAHVGSLDYDELQFRVTRADGEVVVDPTTAGRYQGPFGSGDQDVLIYLRDDLGGSQLHCEATALRAVAVVAAGAGDVTVVRGEMKELEIFMADPGGGPADPGGGPADPGGGPADPGGGTAVPDGGSADPGTTPGKPNGEACSLDAECLTNHCADGVCCESDCKMGCHSCGLADSRGLCRPVGGGAADPHGMCRDQGAASCKQTGLCAVDGTCAVYAAGTLCGEAGCSDGGKMVTPAGVCNGAGKCESAPKTTCGPNATCVAGVCTDAPAPLP